MPKRQTTDSRKKENSLGPVPAKVPKVNNIAARDTIVAATQPGDVLTFGQGDVGQLGLGDNMSERTRPVLVPNVHRVITVCAGGMHTLCLTEDGKIISFGCNDEGALGRETSDEGSEAFPGYVELPSKVVQVTAGDSHSAALLDDGRVFVWGAFRDSHGSMGLTLNGIEKLPVEFFVNGKVVKIASGADHFVMLTANGNVYTCGAPEQGQLGRLSERNASRESRHGLSPLLVPAPVNFHKRIKAEDIWAGQHSTFVKVKSSSTIFVFGLNNHHQLGIRSKLVFFHPIKSDSFSNNSWSIISGGQHHTLALDKNGVTHVLGRHEYGRLGLGENGADAYEPTIIPTLQKKKCVNVACGSTVSFAVTEEGDLYSWGMGTNCQLGTGNENDVYVPTKVTGKHLEGRRAVQVSAGGQHTVLLTVV